MKRISLGMGELFCGPGGLAKGSKLAHLSVGGTEYRFSQVWASDYDADACETFRNNICPSEGQRVLCEDIHELDIGSLGRLGKIDGFAYGFPCNDFSVVGKHKGFDGKFGPLYGYGLKVLDRYRPKFFLAENVSGITSANDGSAFRKIVDDLEASGNGYEVTAHLYRAEDYGVAQTRHRVIMVGIEKKLKKKFLVPAPTTFGNPRTAKDVLERHQIPPDAFNHERTKQSGKVIERLGYIRPGENVWTAKLPKSLMLNVKDARLSQIYKRLHPDRPSYTITGSGGGGTHGYHYAEPRALTNRERARIQSFPDDFKFYGSKESVRRQIGMAVPVELSRIIFIAILKTLHGVPYKNIGIGTTDRLRNQHALCRKE